MSDSQQSLNFSRELWKIGERNWQQEEKSKTLVKIQRDIFPGDMLSLLQFFLVMMSLSHKLGKCIGGYKLTTLQEKINHQMYVDDIKLFAKNEKELETLI